MESLLYASSKQKSKLTAVTPCNIIHFGVRILRTIDIIALIEIPIFQQLACRIQPFNRNTILHLLSSTWCYDLHQIHKNFPLFERRPQLLDSGSRFYWATSVIGTAIFASSHAGPTHYSPATGTWVTTTALHLGFMTSWCPFETTRHVTA